MSNNAPHPHFFGYSHLPEDLQAASKPFHDLALTLYKQPWHPERDMAIRYILMAKDAAVRACVAPWATSFPQQQAAPSGRVVGDPLRERFEAGTLPAGTETRLLNEIVAVGKDGGRDDDEQPASMDCPDDCHRHATCNPIIIDQWPDVEVTGDGFYFFRKDFERDPETAQLWRVIGPRAFEVDRHGRPRHDPGGPEHLITSSGDERTH